MSWRGVRGEGALVRGGSLFCFVDVVALALLRTNPGVSESSEFSVQ